MGVVHRYVNGLGCNCTLRFPKLAANGCSTHVSRAIRKNQHLYEKVLYSAKTIVHVCLLHNLQNYAFHYNVHNVTCININNQLTIYQKTTQSKHSPQMMCVLPRI